MEGAAPLGPHGRLGAPSRAFSPRFIQASANDGVEIDASGGSSSVPHLLRNSAGLMWSSAAYAKGRRSASRIITIVSATEVLGQPTN